MQQPASSGQCAPCDNNDNDDDDNDRHDRQVDDATMTRPAHWSIGSQHTVTTRDSWTSPFPRFHDSHSHPRFPHPHAIHTISIHACIHLVAGEQPRAHCDVLSCSVRCLGDFAVCVWMVTFHLVLLGLALVSSMEAINTTPRHWPVGRPVLILCQCQCSARWRWPHG